MRQTESILLKVGPPPPAKIFWIRACWNHKLMTRKEASTRFVKSILPFACTCQRVEGERNERAERKL